jgi:hypothetical protein
VRQGRRPCDGFRSRGALQLLCAPDLWPAGRGGGTSVSAILERRLAQSEGTVCRLRALRERRMRRVRSIPSHVHRPCRPPAARVVFRDSSKRVAVRPPLPRALTREKGRKRRTGLSVLVCFETRDSVRARSQGNLDSGLVFRTSSPPTGARARHSTLETLRLELTQGRHSPSISSATRNGCRRCAAR